MKKRIHILEDDRDIGNVIELLLKNEGYDLQISSTVKEMKMKLRNAIPDLFILDVMLPDGNGIEICHDLKHDIFTKHIPVMLMSANIRSKQMSTLATPDDYVSKPFDLDDIEKRIKLLLNRS